MTETRKPVDERWSSYPETVLHFPGEPPAMVDLRVPVESSIRNAFQALGLAAEFAVLTAFNPRGVDASQEENDDRMRELEAELESVGHSFVRLDACSPDKSHCECSVAISTSLDEAIEIAKRWKQIAIFWWDLSSFWIYGGISDADPIKLPVQ
ncbi:MAG TPA: DUF3293 domain-containing protein [Gemmatimonadaceae bacterium]